MTSEVLSDETFFQSIIDDGYFKSNCDMYSVFGKIQYSEGFIERNYDILVGNDKMYVKKELFKNQNYLSEDFYKRHIADLIEVVKSFY